MRRVEIKEGYVLLFAGEQYTGLINGSVESVERNLYDYTVMIKDTILHVDKVIYTTVKMPEIKLKEVS